MYDELGRTVSETSSLNRTTKATYDAVSQVTRLTLPDGQHIDYGYDPVGQVTSQETPWGDLAYEWRADGVLSGIDRSDGVTTTIVSDAEQRPISITHAEPAVQAEPEEEAATEVVFPSRTPAVCQEDGTASYLEHRTLQNLEGDDEQCVKTADYLNRRTVPAPEDPVGDGGALHYGYSYTPAGYTSSMVREILGELPAPEARALDPNAEATVPVRPVLESTTRDYSYDALGRLVGSTVTDTTPQSEEALGSELNPAPQVISESLFGYDKNGNRTHTKTTAPDEVIETRQVFADGNRITSQTTTGGEQAGIREYEYDGAGRRTSERGVGGADTDYEYGWGGMSTSVRVGDRTTETEYDGLGRAVSQQVSTQYGTDSVSESFFGGAQVERTSAQHGDSVTLWGATGKVAGIGTDTSDAARWALLDGLTSVVAEASGGAGDISQVASYGEYGMPSFASSGFAQHRGYTGEIQDGGTGMMSFASRSYDPSSGSWLTPDAWPGLLVAPQTLNAYAYVLGNPTTFVDEGGYWPIPPNIFWQAAAAVAIEAAKVVMGVRAAAAAVVGAGARAAVRGASPSRPSSAGGAGGGAGVQSGNSTVRNASSYSGSFTQVRHATATRDCTASIWAAQGCAAIAEAEGQIALGEAILDWAQTEEGQEVLAGIVGGVLFIATRGRSGLRGFKLPSSSAASGLRSVDDVLKDLPKGKNSHFRTVPDERTLRSTFDEMIKDGKPIDVPGYKGQYYELSNGTRVGLREGSKSGGLTIDIRTPGQPPRKVHIQ